MSQQSEMMEAIRPIVADVLSVELDEVTPEASFAADLGGESIDLLELGFRFERELGARVRFGDLTSDDFEVTDERTLTAPALGRLKERFPELDVDAWRTRRFDRPLELLTIADIAAIVRSEIVRNSATAA